MVTKARYLTYLKLDRSFEVPRRHWRFGMASPRLNYEYEEDKYSRFGERRLKYQDVYTRDTICSGLPQLLKWGPAYPNLTPQFKLPIISDGMPLSWEIC
jgi:hypothetical protein